MVYQEMDTKITLHLLIDEVCNVVQQHVSKAAAHVLHLQLRQVVEVHTERQGAQPRGGDYFR